MSDKSVSKKNTENEIVGQTPDSRPITRKELDEKFEISFEQIKNGETVSLEDAIKESEIWLKEDKF